MEIVLYTTNCPQCQVLEATLKSKKVPYSTVTDMQKIMSVAAAANIQSVPIMQLNGVVMPYADALRWANEYQEAGDSDAG